MKIVSDSPEKMVLKTDSRGRLILMSVFALIIAVSGTAAPGLAERPVFTILFGFAVFAIGLAPVFFPAQIELDAKINKIALHRREFFWTTVEVWSLDQLSEAIVETSMRGGDGPAHRIALVIAKGRHTEIYPVVPAYEETQQAKRAADTINRWLDSHRPTP